MKFIELPVLWGEGEGDVKDWENLTDLTPDYFHINPLQVFAVTDSQNENCCMIITEGDVRIVVPMPRLELIKILSEAV